MGYFAGLDVSLRSCAVCIVDNKGKVIFERELACEVADISDCLQRFPNRLNALALKLEH